MCSDNQNVNVSDNVQKVGIIFITIILLTT